MKTKNLIAILGCVFLAVNIATAAENLYTGPVKTSKRFGGPKWTTKPGNQNKKDLDESKRREDMIESGSNITVASVSSASSSSSSSLALPKKVEAQTDPYIRTSANS